MFSFCKELKWESVIFILNKSSISLLQLLIFSLVIFDPLGGNVGSASQSNISIRWSAGYFRVKFYDSGPSHPQIQLMRGCLSGLGGQPQGHKSSASGCSDCPAVKDASNPDTYFDSGWWPLLHLYLSCYQTDIHLQGRDNWHARVWL